MILKALCILVKDCAEFARIKEMLKNWFVSKHEIGQCLKVTKRNVCLLTHPVCLISTKNGTVTSIKSPLCSDSIETNLQIKVCSL